MVNKIHEKMAKINEKMKIPDREQESTKMYRYSKTILY